MEMRLFRLLSGTLLLPLCLAVCAQAPHDDMMAEKDRPDRVDDSARSRIIDIPVSQQPRVFVLDADFLAEQRQKLLASPTEHQPVLTVIRDMADRALLEGPWSVMDKKFVPPSGDKHDYMSVGPYWWPDPRKPDGLPYIRRDGETNPERYEYDSSSMKSMIRAVVTLATAWYFTDDARYAERAVLLLRTWFLDTATKMNPHLQYGQAIRGITEGRDIGIIDTATMVQLIDAVGLLQLSDAWSDSDQYELQQWFRSYLDWLVTSAHGRSEADRTNNHAVWYHVQVASFALFVGDLNTAEQVFESVGPRLIDKQVEPDGRLPKELARTRPFQYTTMTLRAFLNLASMGETVGVDIWRYRSDDGRSIEQALEWFEPFVAGRADWEYPQIKPFDPSSAALLYRRAASVFDKPSFNRIAASVDDPVAKLIYPMPGPN